MKCIFSKLSVLAKNQKLPSSSSTSSSSSALAFHSWSAKWRCIPFFVFLLQCIKVIKYNVAEYLYSTSSHKNFIRSVPAVTAYCYLASSTFPLQPILPFIFFIMFLSNSSWCLFLIINSNFLLDDQFNCLFASHFNINGTIRLSYKDR